MEPSNQHVIEFLTKITMNFFVAFGMIVGGCLLAGIASVLMLKSPAIEMLKLASNIKIWAMVAAVGGTIDPIRVIETNFAGGYLSPAFRQIVLFISAFIGAQIGYSLIEWISKGGGDT